jgi:hypothetical protein
MLHIKTKISRSFILLIKFIALSTGPTLSSTQLVAQETKILTSTSNKTVL